MSRAAREAIVNNLGLTVCPYCNHSYVFSAANANFCDLDHLYPKDKFPILAASFYNLIPVCHVCNNKKGDDVFGFNPHETGVTHKDIMNFDLMIKNDRL